MCCSCAYHVHTGVVITALFILPSSLAVCRTQRAFWRAGRAGQHPHARRPTRRCCPGYHVRHPQAGWQQAPAPALHGAVDLGLRAAAGVRAVLNGKDVLR